MTKQLEVSTVVDMKTKQIDAMATGLAATVLKRRREIGLSQEELASRAGLHRTYISDIERGARNISFKSLCRLAIALEIESSALVALSEQHASSSREELLKLRINY